MKAVEVRVLSWAPFIAKILFESPGLQVGCFGLQWFHTWRSLRCLPPHPTRLYATNPAARLQGASSELDRVDGALKRGPRPTRKAPHHIDACPAATGTCDINRANAEATHVCPGPPPGRCIWKPWLMLMGETQFSTVSAPSLGKASPAHLCFTATMGGSRNFEATEFEE